MRKYFVLGFVLILVGCGPASSLWGNSSPLQVAGVFVPTSTVTTPSPFPSVTATATSTSTLHPTFASTATLPSQSIERVLIVSFDGLRGDAIASAPMPNLMRLMNHGAFTLHAHTISYLATLPAHAAMLSGMCMQKNGVNWNKLLYYRGYSKGVDLFDLVHAAGLRTVMIVGKEKLRQVAEPETLDDFEDYVTEASIAQAAIEQMASGFGLMFIHFPSGDARGHRYEWMSNAQFKAFREGDIALAQILAALEDLRLRDSTLIIVTADHGGHKRTHDGTVQVDYDVPWVLSGLGVLPIELTTQVEIMDTAATAAYALELPIPDEWNGVPVYEAFGLPVGERDEVVCP